MLNLGNVIITVFIFGPFCVWGEKLPLLKADNVPLLPVSRCCVAHIWRDKMLQAAQAFSLPEADGGD